jgi:hypothetical protein
MNILPYIGINGNRLLKYFSFWGTLFANAAKFCRFLGSRGAFAFQHIFRKDAISARGVIDKDMRDSAY